jgi:hypothetical protein
MLPFNEAPALRTYAYWSNYLGILDGQGFDTSGLLINNYTTMSYFLTACLVDCRKNAPLRRAFVKQKIDLTRSDIQTYLAQRIQKNQYIVLALNAKYLSEIAFHTDFDHDYLIYGVDDDCSIFNAFGYVLDRNAHAWKYKSFEISFQDLQAALQNRLKKNRWVDDEEIAILDDFVPEEIDYRKVKCKVFCQAYHFLPILKNPTVYRIFFMMNQRRRAHRESPYDLRPLRCMVEHKQLLLRVVKTLAPDFADEYQKVCKNANTLILLATKYNLMRKNKAKYTNQIEKTMKSMEKEEQQILRCVLKNMH